MGAGIFRCADAPRRGTRCEVGATVFDIASEALKCVAAAIVACIGVETVSRLDCGRGAEEQNGRYNDVE